jgi:hypothetical protein
MGPQNFWLWEVDRTVCTSYNFGVIIIIIIIIIAPVALVILKVLPK